ncbi:MAG TPA: DUF433 domain-containing protein [Pyrinomonadaceae bacterium]|nr:DUF433 domain-containing protein [Pyrinomonadaceae bacterium]
MIDRGFGCTCNYATIRAEGITMEDEQLLRRITLDPNIMGGKPIIQGTRLTVEYVLNLLAHGVTTEEILAEYQGLKVEDIQACFLFAAKSLGDTAFMPLSAA